MLNCTLGVECILHEHNNPHHHHHHPALHPLHPSDQENAGEGELGPPPYEILDVNDVIQGLLNDTDSELSSLSHLDAPNENVYMMSGMLIAMLLVAVIIVLLAVTISKLRKRGEVMEPAENPRPASAPQQPQQHPVLQQSPTLVTLAEPPMSNLYQPTTAWNYPAAHFLYSTQDQETNITPLASEQPGFCKGVRKNLGGKWKRLVRRKSVQETCAVSRDHLKQIYVY